MVEDLPGLLEPGSLLVFNDSRVRKARLLGKSLSGTPGAGVEFLLVDKLSPDGRLWRVMSRRTKRRKPGSRYVFALAADEAMAEIAGEEGEFKLLRFDRPIDDAWLDRYGHIPLPPYIRREDQVSDSERYQTVYASPIGSAAAPTAGLHFTRRLLADLEAAGMEIAFITLHVGLGTFLPVRVEKIEDHVMHRESYRIDDETASRIEAARNAGRRIVAVGTTSLRTLESAWESGGAKSGDDSRRGKLRRGEGDTSIFIYPGYLFKAVDQLFTNFHTPLSTLLMLAAAFAGRELILESYNEAVREGYRFFSYGDAMLIR
jgi:S-adenosylmethionine:tRNA ribosyltransferase-isomerase